jgi:hypothetical protein
LVVATPYTSTVHAVPLLLSECGRAVAATNPARVRLLAASTAHRQSSVVVGICFDVVLD